MITTTQKRRKEHNTIVKAIIEDGFTKGMGGGVTGCVYKGWVLLLIEHRVDNPQIITAAVDKGLTQVARENLERGAKVIWDRAIKCLKQYKVTGNVITRREVR